ncbi:hypothetical protein [uncultured Winogradskyella sp.]|uniref:hypothetical protein n=1 Tax=uncultured Winogradskyella sp. TaxID=395353 RepID=UPI002602F890|nr:hypothetical protein [uncultured Winogradskyella sp.]|tara:strand:+ start:1460 stop:2098 length:639 start_codon:yes stop_codon:yes gene_type:complete
MKRIVYLCFFAILLSSCATDNDDNLQNSDSNFYALTVGNEWVYKNYKYNPETQNYDDTGVVDSVRIIGTETINDNTYYKFRRLTTGNEEGITLCNPNGEHFELLRDSLGYLIYDGGMIKYANNDFAERTLSEQDWGTVYDQLIALDNEITIEAGTFDSTYTQRYAMLTNGEQANGLDHFYYADGFGLIYDTSSLVAEDIPRIVRRLDSYVIE